jgi:hypothetical protein
MGFALCLSLLVLFVIVLAHFGGGVWGGGGGGGGNMGILYSLPSILALFAKHASKQAKVCKVGLDPFGSTPTQTMKSMVCRK